MARPQPIIPQQTVDSTTYYYNKIINPKTPEDLPKGYAYFKRQKEELLSKQDTLRAIYALRMLAMSEFEMGRIYASENSAIDALALLDETSNEIKIAADAEIGMYNHLGMIYNITDQPRKAVKTYTIALKKTNQLGDSITLLNNMANSYKELEQYEKAISILEWVYVKSAGQKNKIKAARALDNLGNTQAKAGYAQGLTNMLEALELRKEAMDNSELFVSFKHLSEYYKKVNDSASARFYATLGKEAANQVSVAYKKEALAHYLGLSDNQDILEYVRIIDSTSSATLQQDKKFASIEYDFTKEKERTQAAEIAEEKERQQKSIFQLLGLCIGLLTIGLYFVLKFRHKKEKIEQLYQTESRISKKVHDEVANDLYKIMAKIQTSQNKGEALLDDLESVYQKTRDISKESSLIQMDEDFGSVIRGLLLNYQSDHVNVITKNLANINWDSISELKKITLYRVLQELMTNMRKHSKATVVVISANQSGKKLDFIYTDNGIGSELKRGNGLLNTENRIRSVNGTIIFDSTSNKGFTAKISL